MSLHNGAGCSHSSVSTLSVIFTNALGRMTKHSCRVFADLGLTPDAGTCQLLVEARRPQCLA